MPNPSPTKPLGNPRGSINSPIVASAMALLLGIYCITSIRSARRDAAGAPATPSTPSVQSYRERPAGRHERPAWMQQALDEEKRSRGAQK